MDAPEESPWGDFESSPCEGAEQGRCKAEATAPIIMSPTSSAGAVMEPNTNATLSSSAGGQPHGAGKLEVEGAGSSSADGGSLGETLVAAGLATLGEPAAGSAAEGTAAPAGADAAPRSRTSSSSADTAADTGAILNDLWHNLEPKNAEAIAALTINDKGGYTADAPAGAARACAGAGTAAATVADTATRSRNSSSSAGTAADTAAILNGLWQNLESRNAEAVTALTTNDGSVNIAADAPGGGGGATGAPDAAARSRNSSSSADTAADTAAILNDLWHDLESQNAQAIAALTTEDGSVNTAAAAASAASAPSAVIPAGSAPAATSSSGSSSTDTDGDTADILNEMWQKVESTKEEARRALDSHDEGETSEKSDSSVDETWGFVQQPAPKTAAVMTPLPGDQPRLPPSTVQTSDAPESGGATLDAANASESDLLELSLAPPPPPLSAGAVAPVAPVVPPTSERDPSAQTSWANQAHGIWHRPGDEPLASMTMPAEKVDGEWVDVAPDTEGVGKEGLARQENQADDQKEEEGEELAGRGEQEGQENHKGQADGAEQEPEEEKQEGEKKDGEGQEREEGTQVDRAVRVSEDPTQRGGSFQPAATLEGDVGAETSGAEFSFGAFAQVDADGAAVTVGSFEGKPRETNTLDIQSMASPRPNVAEVAVAADLTRRGFEEELPAPAEPENLGAGPLEDSKRGAEDTAVVIESVDWGELGNSSVTFPGAVGASVPVSPDAAEALDGGSADEAVWSPFDTPPSLFPEENMKLDLPRSVEERESGEASNIPATEGNAKDVEAGRSEPPPPTPGKPDQPKEAFSSDTLEPESKPEGGASLPEDDDAWGAFDEAPAQVEAAASVQPKDGAEDGKSQVSLPPTPGNEIEAVDSWGAFHDDPCSTDAAAATAQEISPFPSQPAAPPIVSGAEAATGEAVAETADAVGKGSQSGVGDSGVAETPGAEAANDGDELKSESDQEWSDFGDFEEAPTPEEPATPVPEIAPFPQPASADRSLPVLLTAARGGGGGAAREGGTGATGGGKGVAPGAASRVAAPTGVRGGGATVSNVCSVRLRLSYQEVFLRFVTPVA